MANTQTAFGFRHIGFISGAAPDYQLNTGVILSSNGTKIYRGDPICRDPTTGAIVQGANNTSTVVGVFDGCMYTPVAGGPPTWLPYWPGSAYGPATAYFIDAPGALFLAACLNTSIVTANIDENVGYAIGTGSTLNGFSGATVDQSTLNTTNTLPFRVYALGSQYMAAGQNGADVSTAYGYVVVTFNSQRNRQLTGLA
ncbi:MAG: hypothetical protein WC829_20150 [Hyphomicrobium sp.]